MIPASMRRRFRTVSGMILCCVLIQMAAPEAGWGIRPGREEIWSKSHRDHVVWGVGLTVATHQMFRLLHAIVWPSREFQARGDAFLGSARQYAAPLREIAASTYQGTISYMDNEVPKQSVKLGYWINKQITAGNYFFLPELYVELTKKTPDHRKFRQYFDVFKEEFKFEVREPRTGFRREPTPKFNRSPVFRREPAPPGE